MSSTNSTFARALLAGLYVQLPLALAQEPPARPGGTSRNLGQTWWMGVVLLVAVFLLFVVVRHQYMIRKRQGLRG